MTTQISQVQISEHNTTGIFLRCPHVCCNGRIWRYRGTMSIYAVCPNCRKPVAINYNKVTAEEMLKYSKNNNLASSNQPESQVVEVVQQR